MKVNPVWWALIAFVVVVCLGLVVRHAFTLAERGPPDPMTPELTQVMEHLGLTPCESLYGEEAEECTGLHTWSPVGLDVAGEMWHPFKELWGEAPSDMLAQCDNAAWTQWALVMPRTMAPPRLDEHGNWVLPSTPEADLRMTLQCYFEPPAGWRYP